MPHRQLGKQKPLSQFTDRKKGRTVGYVGPHGGNCRDIGKRGEAFSNPCTRRNPLQTSVRLARIPETRKIPRFLRFSAGLAHGIDSRRVVPEHAAKSISRETTFATDITELGVVRAWILELSEQVGWRLRRHGLTARTVHLKVRYPDFHTITRAQKLAQVTDATQVIWQTADRLVTTRLPGRRLECRLLGLGVSGLERGKPVQRTLFPETDPQRQSRLDQVADRIKDKFGGASLRRGLGMLYDVNPPFAFRSG